MQTQIPVSFQFDLGQFVAFFAQLPHEYKIQIFESLKPYLANNQEDKQEENVYKTTLENKVQSLEKFKGGLANYQSYETTKQEWYEQ
jgi:hypothetical protein